MKFTEEEAIQKMKSDYAVKEKDLDLTRTISENVKNVLAIVGNDENLELSDFIQKVNPLIETAVGLMRHETKIVAVSKQKEIDEWKSKVEGKPNQNEFEEKASKRIEDLEKALAEMKNKDTVSLKKKEILVKVKEKVKNEKMANEMVNLMTITSDSNVDDIAKKVIESYNSMEASHVFVETPKKPKPVTKESKQNFLDGLAKRYEDDGQK